MDNGALALFRNRTIGFVFQFHHLLPEFTALENVMMPGLISFRDRAELKAHAEGLSMSWGCMKGETTGQGSFQGENSRGCCREVPDTESQGCAR